MLSCVDHTTRTPMWLFRTAFVFLPSIFVRFHAKESMKDQKKPIHKVLLRKSLLLCCMGRNEDKGSFSCKPEDWYSMQLAVHGVYGEYSGTSSFQGWQCVYLSIDILVIVEGWEPGYKMVSCTEQEKEETEQGGRKQNNNNGQGRENELSSTVRAKNPNYLWHSNLACQRTAASYVRRNVGKEEEEEKECEKEADRGEG